MFSYKRSRKATFLLAITIIYCINIILSGTLYGWMKAYASGDPVDLISVFVDKDVAGDLGDEINWFTKTYIGRNEKNAKVELFVIDKNSVSPADVVKINQNLYLDGEKKGPSRMIGTVLIGDLRLPVVNKNGFIFSTVYPLVDFEKPKYYYNPQTDYFEFQSEGNSQPEIRHSVINFKSTISDYKKYFNKLKQYSSDPAHRTSSDMRYEDILHQKQTVNSDNFDKYINSYIFSEDVMYNRYTNLMVDVFGALHNTGLVEVLSGYDNQLGVNLNDEYYNEPEYNELKTTYKKEIEKFWNLIKNLKKVLGDVTNSQSGGDPEPSNSALGILPNSKFINTMFIQKVVDGFMKSYVELYGTSYFDSKENRLSNGGKYLGGLSGSKADDHISIVTRRDEVSKQLLVDINTKLENELDNKIQKEGYAMNVVIPTKYKKSSGKFFEVFYFGLPAEYLKSAIDFSIFRGTFANIRSLAKLEKYDYSKSMDYDSRQSIGATRGENSREVEAQRGYDFSLIEYDQAEFEKVKDMKPYSKIRKRDKNIDKFISRYWAGYTPLNIDQNSQDIRLNMSKMDYTQLRNPFLDRRIGGPVFSIAGSRITTDDRKLGFTLGTEDEDNNDDSDSTISSNTISYSGYSDSFLGKDFFPSVIQITKDNGDRLKFTNWLKKYKYRNTGKPRIKDWGLLDIYQLGSAALGGGLYLLPSGKSFYDDASYVNIQDGLEKRYYKSIDSRYFHKSPTIEDMYGQYVDGFTNVTIDADLECSDPQPEAQEGASQTCLGYAIKFTDLFPGNVDTVLYAKRGDDYIVTGGKVLFNSSAQWYENGTTINFDGLIGEISSANKLKLTFNGRDYELPWGEQNFDCELRNVESDSSQMCKGITFYINDRSVGGVPEKFIDFNSQTNVIHFYDGAVTQVYGKNVSLANLVMNYNPSTKKAEFSGRKLQIGGINEFTLERPVDSPRYVSFQGIGGNKLTWVYPDVRRIPVYKEVNGKRVLMDIAEIKDSVKVYLRNKSKQYNEDLTRELANKDAFYNKHQSWLQKFEKVDRTISPRIQTDDTSLLLRSYSAVPEDFFIEALATTWKGKKVSSEDMVTILAEQLHHQNIMWQQLPIDISKKVLNETSIVSAFADINYKSSSTMHDYIVSHDNVDMQDSGAIDILYPYYNTGGYELGYINSDGADYVQFETTPPLIKVIQKQKAKQSDQNPKHKDQTNDSSKCGSLIPPSYVVPIVKWPQAFKCWLEEVNDNPFQFSISFVGSAGDVLISSGFKGIVNGLIGSGSELDTQMRQSGLRYKQQRRALVRGEDENIAPDVSQELNKKLENISPEFSTKYPAIGSGIQVTLHQNKDIGTYAVEITTTGSNCLISNGSNLCNGSSVSLEGGKDLTISYLLDSGFPNGIGDVLYQIKLCKNGKCVYRNYVITVEPGNIASFKFISPIADSILPIARGNTLPLILQGFDDKGNRVNSSIYNFKVETHNSGSLIYNNQLSSAFETNSFKDAGFLYDSFGTIGTKESLSISSSDGLSAVKQELSLSIVDPKLELSVSKDNLILPESSSELETQNAGVSYIDPNKLIKLNVSINDNMPIYSLVKVRSLGSKFIIGRKIQKQIGQGSSSVLVDAFEPIDEVIYKGGKLEFYLYPTMKAGDDSIEVSAGAASKSQIITISPAKAKKTVLNVTKDVLEQGSNAKATVEVTDIWGNRIQKPTKVLLGLFGNIKTDVIQGSGSTIEIQGIKEFTIDALYPGGQAYLFATLPDLSFEDQYPDYASILVQNRSRPIDKLNIAYLNLYGSNRANKYDSQTNKEVGSALLAEGAKTLSVTTQLTSLSSVFKSVLVLKQDGTLMSLVTKDANSQNAFEATVVGGISGYVTDYGRLAFGLPIDQLKQKREAAIDTSHYKVIVTNYGQSNDQALFLQEISQTLENNDNTAPSIQHSKDSINDIGFGDYFKPMTLFAQGRSVGDSTKDYASEYVINLGDPSYRAGENHKLVDGTPYDPGIGDVVYSDPENRVEQVLDIDWDKTGDRDLLIIYSNGKIKILVSVGNGHYKPLGDVAYIADGIKKAYVGDGDGDGRQDIFIHTLANQLRFYKNYDGKRLDVDGYPICLGIDSNDNQNEEGGTKLDNVYQWFLTDPNKDKVTDIVVLDKNNTIQLFLGGGSSNIFEIGFGGGNYISRDKLVCDPGRQKRQKNKKSIVKSYAPGVNDVEIRDESLVHRDGLKNTDNGTINPNADNLEEPDKVDANIAVPDPGNKPNASKIKQLIGTIKNQVMDIASPKKWMEEYINSLENTVTLDQTYRPVYESGTGEVVYKQLSSLLDTDKLDVYKKFVDLNGGRLEDGDIVKIEIHIKNKGAHKATYLEKLSGPWEIPVSGNKQIGFFSGDLNTDHQFILAPGPSYVFMVDNISIGGDIKFGYHAVFKSQQLVSIKHGEDFTNENGIGGSIGKLVSKARAQNDDDLPAWLEVTPLDGCAKFIWKIFAENIGGSIGNRFRESKIDLAKEIEDKKKVDEQAFNSGYNNSFNDLVNDTKEGISDEITNAYLKESRNQKGILEEDGALQDIEYLANVMQGISNLNVGFQANVGLFGGDVDQFLDKKIGDLTKGLCEGFKVGQKSCSGIPVLSSLPWNMAFLSPGDMQVMGCKIFKDKGLPLVWFPATLQTPIGPIPFIGPIGQKGPGDGFYWIGGGTYTSLIRVYFSPTLTAKLGIGICFGPYSMGINFPKPFKDIAGNCIVFAVDPGIGKCQVEKDKETGKYVIPKELKRLDTDSVCNDDITVKNSPLKLVETSVNGADNWLESSQGQYGLVIKLGGSANLTNYNSISLSDFVDKVRIEGGNPLDLKIKSAKDSGLVSCIMNQFVDNQIRYIVNNLTTLNLNIILPDFKGLIDQGQIIGTSIAKAGTSFSTIKDDTQSAKDARGDVWSRSGDKQKIAKKMDAVLGNPMDKLAELFNESELIHISTRDVLIEVPWVYMNDLGKAKGIYKSWLERNKPIIEAWKNTSKDIMQQCKSIQDQFERENCENSANTILQINNQMGQFDRSIRQNLETIDMYGKLPSQMYELLHGYDAYIYDVFNLAYGTIDAITSWFSKIARGLDARVNFIISLTGIIKSRQILIDFSVNRKEKCSKCTVDNYSAYSCSFKGFCPKIPVFAIPPFKIPSFTLDLSNLDLSTEIVLPRFRFQPKKIGLFDNLLQFGLPDIPYPPGIHGNINIKLPIIPTIPRPPDLSTISLPSFIPQIQFKGPTLPPAPKIPKIAPELGMAIDVASFIGRIFCIVKGGIGLVAEAGLKSRIEQMTQRTWNVEPFDSLKLLVPATPLQTRNIFKPLRNEGGSFDMKFEAYVDVKSYFGQIYDLFDGVASLTNKWTGKLLRDSDQLPGVSDATKRLKRQYNNGDGFLEDYDEVNLQSTISPFGYLQTDSYSSVNTKLSSDLEYFVTKDDQPNSKKRQLLAQEVKGSYSLNTSVSFNSIGINEVKNKASGIMNSELKSNAQQMDRIKQDYDGWLDHIAMSQYVSNDSLNLSFGTNIASIDHHTLQYLNAYDVAKEYISTQKQVTDGYVSALQQTDYKSLGIKKSDYDQSLAYLKNLQNNIQITEELRDSIKLTNNETHKSYCTLCGDKVVSSDNGEGILEGGSQLLAQNSSSQGQSSNGNQVASVVNNDPAAYIRGYFVRGNDGDYHNVIANIEKGEAMSKKIFEKDLDADNKREIIGWDDHSVYVKRAKNKYESSTSNAEVNRFDINSIDDLLGSVDSYGYANNVKLRSEYFMPKERKVSGQTYKSLSYTVDAEGGLDDGIDGFVVRYIDDINSSFTKDSDYSYLLILHNSWQGRDISSLDIDGVKLDLGKNLHIDYSDLKNNELGVVLSSLPRRRYHTQVAKLKSREQVNPLLKFIPFISKKPSLVIAKSSPWSSSETAGMQIVADSSSPYAEVGLRRDKSNKMIAQGDTLYGTIKTYYSLSGNWYDDSKVIRSWILDGSGMVLYSGNTDAILVTGIYSDKPYTYKYQLFGEDAAGNIGSKNVTIFIQLPELKLDDVQVDSLGQSEAISSLNSDVDYGQVQFVRVRNGVESILQSAYGGKNIFDAITNQITITGGKFAFKPDIGFYDANGKFLNVSITPEGQIISNNSSILITVDFREGYPTIALIQNNQELYTIYLKAKEMDTKSGIIMVDGTYEIFGLPNNVAQLAQYSKGFCIKPKNGPCEVLVAPNGMITALKPYNKIYSADYGFKNGNVVYTLKKGKNPIAEVSVKVEEVK